MVKSRAERKQIEKQTKKKRRWPKVLGIIILIGLAIGLGTLHKAYTDVAKTTDNMYTEVEDKEDRREKSLDINSGDDPFSVLLMGVDTGTMGRASQGRSDTIMLLTVNPKEGQSVITSIPRDTYTEISGRGTMDKINHAYAFGGPSMSINTVQNLFDIPVDYYVDVNMQGLTDIIDTFGGIEVIPNFTFTQGGYYFTEGVPIQLDGASALEYSRMRKQDPQGDYGRQERQRQIIEASLQKAASISTIMNYQSVLSTLENNMSTNLTFNEMIDIFGNYRAAASNIKQEQLSGTGQMINGVYYEIIPDEEISRVSEVLKGQLEI